MSGSDENETQGQSKKSIPWSFLGLSITELRIEISTVLPDC